MQRSNEFKCGEIGCGHCKIAKPDFAQAAATIVKESLPASFAAVDCTRFAQVSYTVSYCLLSFIQTDQRSLTLYFYAFQLCQKYKVSGYPTIQFFKNGKFSLDYNEGRKSTDFIKFVKKHANGHQEL